MLQHFDGEDILSLRKSDTKMNCSRLMQQSEKNVTSNKSTPRFFGNSAAKDRLYPSKNSSNDNVYYNSDNKILSITNKNNNSNNISNDRKQNI